jgi:hypothetical protein
MTLCASGGIISGYFYDSYPHSVLTYQSEPAYGSYKSLKTKTDCSVVDEVQNITESNSWRLWADDSHTTAGWAWDIKEIKLYSSATCSGTPIVNDGTAFDSGNAGGGWGPENAFKSGGTWGGRKDEYGHFYVGMTFSSSKEVRCVEIRTSGDKSATEVRIQAYNSASDTWENAFIAKTFDSSADATNIIPLQETASPSSLPSSFPSSAPSAPPVPLCPNPNHIHVELRIKTDAQSRQNKIIMRDMKRKKIVWRVKKLPKKKTVSYSKCVSQGGCYQVLLTDRGRNGIKNGSFSVTVNGVLLQSTKFQSGKRWKSRNFGTC